MSPPPPAAGAGRPARLLARFSHMPGALALVWRSSRAGTVVLGLLTLVSAALPIAIAWAGKRIVDAVVARSDEETLRWVLIELGLVAGQALVQRGLTLVRQLLGARLSLDIHGMILEKALGLELRHFEDATFYDRLTRARREASSRPVAMVTDTFQLVQNGLTLAGYVVALLRFDVLAVGALLLAAIPATIVEMRYSKAAFRLRNWRAPETRRLHYLEYVLANDEHAKEVKVLGLGPELLGRYRRLGEQFYREDRSMASRRAGWAYALSLLATGAFYGFYAIMALQAARGRLSLGELTFYVIALRQGQQAFQSILLAIGGMYENNLYMSNLFDYLAIPTREGGGDVPLEPGPPPAPGDGVRFEGVGFRYPGQEGWALRDVTLHVPPGTSLALVGHNGAGKTTFIKLLTRLYEPTEGRILLDGRDLRAWDPEALRARIGVVFQDFNQYQLTVGENVGVGSLPHLGDRPRLERAVERGGAAEDVARLPKGIETPLGRWFHEGLELSGGQWQKVALARAFMREEADLLILDEPTAALDAEAEHRVFERFRQLARGRTAILISHRFPTVRMADRIVVLDGGRIVEAGTHEELVARDGRYAALFRLQAAGYA